MGYEMVLLKLPLLYGWAVKGHNRNVAIMGLTSNRTAHKERTDRAVCVTKHRMARTASRNTAPLATHKNTVHKETRTTKNVKVEK